MGRWKFLQVVNGDRAAICSSLAAIDDTSIWGQCRKFCFIGSYASNYGNKPFPFTCVIWAVVLSYQNREATQAYLETAIASDRLSQK